jgi:CubicO group peptidase (beta-lactamase class C family)
MFFGDNRSWGMGVSVFTTRDDLATSPGRFGWEGGYGASWYADPREQLTGVLLTQRLMDSSQAPHAFADFWTFGLSGDRRLAFCFDAFSSREPASTSLENAIGRVKCLPRK